MKLHNKNTNKIFDYDIYLTKSDGEFGCVDYKYETIKELNEDWEDYNPKEITKYYMINEETGYVVTFDTEHEMAVFGQELKGWRQVKVSLDKEEE